MQRAINSGKLFIKWQNIFNAIKKKETQSDPLIYEIAEVLQRLEAINSKFEFETESEMIDSCIYEQRALNSRYAYLLAEAKRRGISCSHTEALKTKAELLI